ncbi:MAG: DUF427 domain-containing protein [Polyangiaceae bacterium]|nr:DUF427 domain-containing protein [Polyangiaceae bacterium]
MFIRPHRIAPGPGQESVWDYPRPPRVELVSKRLRVVFAGVTLVDSTRAVRVLETSHPPVYYFPPADVRMDLLIPNARTSFCEWKGVAEYRDVCVGDRVEAAAAWVYTNPTPGFEAIRGFPAFYPARMDACYVGEERARPQPGSFYAGWITNDIVGPFKGEPGTMGW